jgi:hypothetical protein
VINQMAVNWTVFYRAIGNTKPIAVGGVVMAIGSGVIATPLLLTEGLVGFAFGYGIAVCVFALVRLYYLNKLFSLPLVLRNIVRGMTPGLIAFAATGGLRLLVDHGTRTELMAIGELALFAVVAAVMTFRQERDLLSELIDYLRNRRPTRMADPTAA